METIWRRYDGKASQIQQPVSPVLKDELGREGEIEAEN